MYIYICIYENDYCYTKNKKDLKLAFRKCELDEEDKEKDCTNCLVAVKASLKPAMILWRSEWNVDH